MGLIDANDPDKAMYLVHPATGEPVDETNPLPTGPGATDFGAASGAGRTAAQIGNASGAADFDSGNAGAQTLRVAVDGTKITAAAMPTGGVGAIGWLSGIWERITALIALFANGYGVVTAAIRTASQIGDASGNAVAVSDVAGHPADGQFGLTTQSVIHGHTTAGGGAFVDVKATPAGALSVAADSLPLPAGASTEATLATRLTESDFDTKVGSLTEAAPGSDTASSGLNGRLQRIAQRLSTSITSDKPTYSAMADEIAVAASATDFFEIAGSATKTVKILEIRVWGTRTTGALNELYLLLRSTANSSGTPTTLTAIPQDSADDAATAVAKSYTANPTTGTLVGMIDDRLLEIRSPTATVEPTRFEIDFTKAGKPLILRGVNEVLVFNLNGVTVTGGAFTVYVKWTEE